MQIFFINIEECQGTKDLFSFRYKFNEWIINIQVNLNIKLVNLKMNWDNLRLFIYKIKRLFYDSIYISKDISSDYVLFWVEDHILINSLDSLKICILEMRDFNVDQLRYSFS